MILYTVGYGCWPAARRMAGLVAALRQAGVRRLIDTRHSPCSANPEAGGTYGPRDWNLQAGDAGLAPALLAEGIEYRWLVELGNPQKNDPAMTILREHLASGDERWPVNRGMLLLRELLESAPGPCAVLCACADYRKCHRTVIALEAQKRFPSLHLDVRRLP